MKKISSDRYLFIWVVDGCVQLLVSLAIEPNECRVTKIHVSVIVSKYSTICLIDRLISSIFAGVVIIRKISPAQRLS